MGDILFGVLCALCIYNVTTQGPSPIKSGKWWRSDYDVSDDAKNNKRSNMTVYTDYGTGCQYIRAGMGGITPRLDESGKIMCVRDQPDAR